MSLTNFARPRFNSFSTVASDSYRYLTGQKNAEKIVCCNTTSPKECLYSAQAEFIPLFLKGCCVKMFMELVSKRSFKHLWKEMKVQVPRFGLVCGAISTVYMLVMCVLRRNTNLSHKKSVIIAAFLSSLPAIVGFTKKEAQLFKLLVYPLMFRCLF